MLKLMERKGCMMQYLVRKRLNNNVILTDDAHGAPTILIGRGIGFSAAENQWFTDLDRIEQRFILSSQTNQTRFKELVATVDPDLIAIIEECLRKIQDETGGYLNENIHTTLPDHMWFALQRHQKGLDFHNPFNEELKYIYPEEYKLASSIIDRINQFYSVQLVEDEIGIVAIHIHSARQNESIQVSRKCARLIEQTVAGLYDMVSVKPEKNSLMYHRILVHCRMAFERILRSETIDDVMLDVIKREYRQEFLRTRRLLDRIAAENGIEIPDSEVGYLVIHVKRLESSGRSQGRGPLPYDK